MRGASLLYSDMSYSPINGIDEDSHFNNLSIDVRELLNDVLSNLAQWTGIELERATHRELPWIEARQGYGEADKCHVEIAKETTRKFYRTQQGL